MKILIVDDSVVFRMAIKQALEEVEGVSVVGTLSNGQLAVDWLQKSRDADLITLDMEMPVLDGLSTIKEIRKFNQRVPIIVFSSLTTKGAEKTIDALSSGANDFVTKEETAGAQSIDNSLEMIRQSLIPKINAFKKKLEKSPAVATPQPSMSSSANPEVAKSPLINMTIKPKLIVMASSTGGPEALSNIFRNLHKGASNVPILLVQHMPPVFTQKLAEMLTNISPGYEIKEGKPGDVLRDNTCYLAPGDYHMVMKPDLTIDLNQNEKVCFVRPAANCLFETVAQNYPQQIASFVLTGMGDDGAEGVKVLNQKGCYNFYQDEASCTVFGMPAAVQRLGMAQEVKLEEVAQLINGINNRI
jgi:two-component system chemotaxis response regulator CheB